MEPTLAGDLGGVVASRSPSAWTAEEVVAWATQSKLAADTIVALNQNQVDGPTLLTLSKADLQSELGIASLPARRNFWELLKSLKDEDVTLDFSAGIDTYQEEIEAILGSSKIPAVTGGDEVSGAGETRDNETSIAAAVEELTLDAQRQKQVVADHMLAHRLQRVMHGGSHTIYEDAERAHQEQERLNLLHEQAERDRVYAESLAAGRERIALRARSRRNETTEAAVNASDRDEGQDTLRLASLFGLCVQAGGNRERRRE